MKAWKVVVLVTIFVYIAAQISSSLLSDASKNPIADKIAIIPIYGIITISGSSDSLFSQGGSTSSEVITEFIKKANEDSQIKAIILEINSPGGEVVASEEIAKAVKDSKKPVVAWIREVGASGAYWVASASDVIVADRLSITGSIGVLASYLEFSGLFEKYGITYQQLTAGELKDVGTPFKKLEDSQRQILQTKLDLIQNVFVSEIAQNRKLPEQKVKELATGIFYLGIEAKENGLIDIIGSKQEAIDHAKKLSGIKEADLVSFQRKRTFLDLLSTLSYQNSFYIGQGIGQALYKNAKLESPLSNIRL